MNDLTTRVGVGFNNIARMAFDRTRSLSRNERGSVVETVIIIAIMVLAAVVIFGLIFRALQEQAANIETCIKGVNNAGKCAGFQG